MSYVFCLSLFICLVFWKSSLHGDHRTSFCFCLLAVSRLKCCTFLFIDVIVSRFDLLFSLCFHFCFQMFKCIKKGYYVLEFFIGVGNRDIMTKELSLICLFFVLLSLCIFLYGIIYPMFIPCCLLNKDCFV